MVQDDNSPANPTVKSVRAVAAKAVKIAANTDALIAVIDTKLTDFKELYTTGHVVLVDGLKAATDALNTMSTESAREADLRRLTEAELWSMDPHTGQKVSNMQLLRNNTSRLMMATFDELDNSRIAPLEEAVKRREKVSWALFVALLGMIGTLIGQWFHADIAKWLSGGK